MTSFFSVHVATEGRIPSLLRAEQSFIVSLHICYRLGCGEQHYCIAHRCPYSSLNWHLSALQFGWNCLIIKLIYFYFKFLGKSQYCNPERLIPFIFSPLVYQASFSSTPLSALHSGFLMIEHSHICELRVHWVFICTSLIIDTEYFW